MLTREQIDNQLVDYLFDELGPGERQAFESALPQHPELEVEVRQHQSLRLRVATLPHDPVPKHILNRIMDEAAHAVRKPSFFERLAAMLMQPAVATAMVFVLIGTTSIVLTMRNDDLSTASPPSTDMSESTEAGPTSQDLSVAQQEAAPELKPAAKSAVSPPPPRPPIRTAKNAGNPPPTRGVKAKHETPTRRKLTAKARKPRRPTTRLLAKKTGRIASKGVSVAAAPKPGNAPRLGGTDADLPVTNRGLGRRANQAPAPPAPVLAAEKMPQRTITNTSKTTSPEQRLEATVERFIRGGKLDKARALLKRLRKQFPGNTSVGKLQKRINALEQARKKDLPEKSPPASKKTRR